MNVEACAQPCRHPYRCLQSISISKVHACSVGSILESPSDTRVEMTPSEKWLVTVFVAGALVAAKGDAYLYSDCDSFPDGSNHYRTCNPCLGSSCKIVYSGNGTCSLVYNGITTLTVPGPCTGGIGTCCDQYECGPTCTPNQVPSVLSYTTSYSITV